MDQVAESKCFDGLQQQFAHRSTANNCDMRFSVFLPAQAASQKLPVLYWLSGLTCTDENFVTKAGAQRYAAEHGIVLVAPDTSPRGEDVPDGGDGEWDFGLGAGFYVSATRPPWAKYYHMYEYIVDELPALIGASFPVDTERQSIFGHSMGGHGALTIALKNPDRYTSVSAFAPVCSPMHCPWGGKALSRYLGEDRRDWEQYDACALIDVATGKRFDLLVDQGGADGFLDEQLKPELLQAACARRDYPLRLRIQEGYDHSYNFIATFVGEHIAFHARHLQQ
jgi:S-formylglutathione hydrolase